MEAAVAPLAAQARAGNVIFLLDGVDEVPAGRRQEVWQAIAALADGVYCPLPLGGHLPHPFL